jgi:hypothetical protein
MLRELHRCIIWNIEPLVCIDRNTVGMIDAREVMFEFSEHAAKPPNAAST